MTIRFWLGRGPSALYCGSTRLDLERLPEAGLRAQSPGDFIREMSLFRGPHWEKDTSASADDMQIFWHGGKVSACHQNVVFSPLEEVLCYQAGVTEQTTFRCGVYFPDSIDYPRPDFLLFDSFVECPPKVLAAAGVLPGANVHVLLKRDSNKEDGVARPLQIVRLIAVKDNIGIDWPSLKRDHPHVSPNAGVRTPVRLKALQRCCATNVRPHRKVVLNDVSALIQAANEAQEALARVQYLATVAMVPVEIQTGDPGLRLTFRPLEHLAEQVCDIFPFVDMFGWGGNLDHWSASEVC